MLAVPTRAQLPRLAALAALSVPVAAGALLLSPSPARAADSPFTITCPKSDGAAGGAAVTGRGQQCGTYADAAPAIVTGSCQPLLCAGGPTFVVRSPSGSTLQSASLGIGHPSSTYTVPAGSPDGTYTAMLSGGGADVSTSFVLQAAPTSSTEPDPAVTPSAPGGVVAPTKRPPTATPSASASSSGSPAPPTSSAGAAPSTGSGHPAAVGGGHQAVVSFPALAPPAGIAALPPLPRLAAPSTLREEGVQGPYGKTLPYDGSATVVEKSAGKPALLGHVADAVDNKQFAESIAAACLALLFAGHLRRFVRRPFGDADL